MMTLQFPMERNEKIQNMDDKCFNDNNLMDCDSV